MKRMPHRFTFLVFFAAMFAWQSPAAPPPTSYRVAGIVVDSLTGQPLSLAEVSLAPATALQDEQTFLTSTDGRFVFTNLAPGKYRLMAGRRGYAVQGLHQHEGYMTAIVAGPGQDSEHIRFPLSPSAVLSGTVSDQWNDPVREAEVILFQQSWLAGSHSLHLFSKTTTDDLGHYRFPHLLPGTYAIGVYAHPWWANFANQAEAFTRVFRSVPLDSMDAPEHMPAVAPNPSLDLVYPAAYFPNANTLADAARISLKPGATETADVTLRPVPSIHLHVRVPPDSPAPVTISNEDGDDAQVITTQPTSGTGVDILFKLGPDEAHVIQPSRKEIAPGLLELSGIPPGDISVTAVTAQSGSESARTQSLYVNADTELDFTSHGSLVDVSGIVLFPKNAALSQQQNTGAEPQAPRPADRPLALEFLNRKTGESFKAPVRESGEFFFAGSALPPGTYDVEFPDDASIQISSLEATGATLSHRTIEIPSGQPVKLTVHMAESNCSLAGIALKNGKPFAGAMILLIPQNADQDPSLFHRDQSDSDGSFSLAPLFPGRYTLLALEKGWELEWSNPAVLLNYLPNGLPLELQPGATPNFNVSVQ